MAVKILRDKLGLSNANSNLLVRLELSENSEVVWRRILKELLKETHMLDFNNPKIQAFAYRHLGRHLMNKNVKKIRDARALEK